jgi:DNA-directed RNA polymerase subunit RPC12/RpoP
MRQIVYNAIKCLECGETIVSQSRHDYVTCECPNEAMVDGGNDYERYGAMDMDKIEPKYIYADDDFEVVRKYATRGSRGVDGRQPLKYIAICDIDDDYLLAILEYGGPEWHLDLIRKEIKYREDGRDTDIHQ